ncbi:MAG: serine/threonine-protein phosphatase [Desulfobacterales bacterium]|nr:serine/threonine-protein phosphatase [Desulfobacterales bacterium]
MKTIGKSLIFEACHPAAGNFFGLSDRGLRKPANEDRYLLKALPDGAVLLAVADGLGDGGAGRQAAETIMQTLSGVTHRPAHRTPAELCRLVRGLDRAVFEAAAADSALEGMGSTLICALVQGCRLDWVHAGDSRLYLLRGGVLTQVTQDQTLARFLMAEGELSPERSNGHYSLQVMDQFVGCGHCEPESGRLDLAPGDLLLLCSDGVHRQIGHNVLTRLLESSADLKTRAYDILKAALATGGDDNITLILAEPSPLQAAP